MKSPNTDALIRPAAGEPLPFIKKDTVMGTIGNTQGVTSAAKPHRIASIIRPQSDSSPSAPAAVTSSAAASGLPIVTLNSQSSGELQLYS